MKLDGESAEPFRFFGWKMLVVKVAGLTIAPITTINNYSHEPS